MNDPSPPPPPRAFTQGLGTVYQFVGVLLFLASMFVCCGSSLLSKSIAERKDLMAVGWNLPLPGGPHLYSAQRAITVSLMLSVFFGIAFAGIGLGLQAEARRAPAGALAVSGVGTAFWIIHSVFFATTLGSILIAAPAGAIALLFGVLFLLAAASVREMRRNPPPPGHEILPSDYKVPYSHLHQDPPEVRIARDLEQRRERLAVQQKELEMLEARLKRKLQGQTPTSDPPGLPATDRPS
jgi:hypothetical protein